MNKLLKSLLILVISFSFATCSTDDDSGSDTSGTLVGTWEMVSFDYSGSTTTEFQGQTIISDFDGVGQNLDYTLAFTENPNEFEGQGSYDIELTSTIAGESTTQVQSIEDTNSTGTYTRAGNTITFEGTLVSVGDMVPVAPQGNNEATISELTNTTLRITQETTQEQMVSGASVSFTLTSEIVFNRL